MTRQIVICSGRERQFLATSTRYYMEECQMWIIDWLTSLGYQQEDLLGHTVTSEGKKHVRHTMQNIDAAIEAVRKNASTRDLYKTTGKRRV